MIDTDRQEQAQLPWIPRLARQPQLQLALVLAVSALLLLFQLSDKSIWQDEAFSISVALFGSDEIWTVINDYGEVNMALYYVVLGVWIDVVGSDPFSVRLLSAVFAFAAIPVLYALGRYLFGHRVGLMAALFMGANAMFLTYAQEVRGYSLLVLMSVSASYVFVRWTMEDRSGFGIAYVFIAVLSAYTHFFGAFVIAAHIVALALRGPSTVLRRQFVRVYGVIGLGWLPLIAVTAIHGSDQASKLDWIPSASFGHVANVAAEVSGGLGLASVVAFLASFYLLYVYGSGNETQAGNHWPFLFMVSLCVVPVLLAGGISVVRPLIAARFLIVLVPPMAILAAAGISAALPRPVAKLLLSCLLAVLLVGSAQWYFAEDKDDWQGASNFVLDRTSSSDGLVVQPANAWRPLAYYMWAAEQNAFTVPAAAFPAVSWQLFEETESLDAPFTYDRERIDRLERYTRIWLLLRRGTSLPDDLSSVLANQFVVTETATFTGIDVAILQRR